jgi:hypothetical protein
MKSPLSFFQGEGAGGEVSVGSCVHFPFLTVEKKINSRKSDILE